MKMTLTNQRDQECFLIGHAFKWANDPEPYGAGLSRCDAVDYATWYLDTYGHLPHGYGNWPAHPVAYQSWRSQTKTRG